MVGMASQNRVCAVKLFRGHNACERVGHGHRSKREQELCLLQRCIRPAIRWPDGKNNMLSALVAARTNPCGEHLRCHLLAAAIKHHKDRLRAPLLPDQPFEERLFRPECLDHALGPRRAPLKIRP